MSYCGWGAGPMDKTLSTDQGPECPEPLRMDGYIAHL